MSKKKITLAIVSIIITILCIIIPNIVRASTTLTTPLYFGVQEFRSGTTPENMAYAINNPYANGSTTDSIVGTKIWQIVKYNSSSGGSFNTGNYYCVRAGVGFSDTTQIAEYNISYDFKTEKSQIESSSNTYLKKIVSNGYYYNLLALTDILYLNGVSTDDDKKALLDVAGIYTTDYYPAEDADYNVTLTESDIEAVQQAAIWYYTNHDDTLFESIYNNLGEDKTSWLFYSTSERDKTYRDQNQTVYIYTSLSDYDDRRNSEGDKIGDGIQRQQQAVLLYNYLINESNKNASAYENGTATSNTKITLYANATKENTQPIILIERIPETKEFDLALRKYITKVNGVSLTDTNSRVPSINESTLSTETTATYRHKKDPVLVETGSIVTYNLTVYNEGEKAGRATKIVDQLPEGLKFSKINTDGFTANYDSSTNRVTITRNADNTKNLHEYYEVTIPEQYNMDRETIELECIVTATPDSNNQKILTNVAWIAEEYDAVDNITITKETGKDRDSEPSTVPSVNKDNMSNYTGNNNKSDLTDSTYYYKGQQDDDDFEKLVLNPAAFDLKLIKRIVEVNGTKVPERIQDVNITNLANGTETTATYILDKNPVSVKKGDIVKYTLRIYNEGDIDGYASEISEDIPEGLEFLWSEKTETELEADTTLTTEEKEAIKYNQGIWDIKTVNKDTSKVELITTDYLAKGKGAEITTNGANLIKAFDSIKSYVNTVNDKNPDYKEISVYMKVTSDDATGKIIRNEAAITNDTDKEGNAVEDRDSKPEEWKKENSDKYYDEGKKWPVYKEDDEDYDNIVLQSFDLALRKFIVAVSSDTTIEDTEYLKNSDGIYTRAPIVNTSKLNTLDDKGKLITTAIYNHTKVPVEVSKGDIVVYMLRVYNEGDIDGYASEIKDHLPPYLEYVDSDFNKTYGWKVAQDGRTVTTTYLSNHMIGKTTKKEDGTIVLAYKEVLIMCKVKDTAKTSEKITNIADITLYQDGNKDVIADRDSIKDNVGLPSDDKLPIYRDEITGDFIPGQEDDDDFEKVIIKRFDLALRKFITRVDEKEVTTRIPQVKYNEENNKITYEHTKEPVDVVTNNIVIYTIRVFNEGEVDGYASKVSDDIPDGLEYLPDNELNEEYRWVMYDSEGKETDDVSKAVKIITDYLSKEQGEARMKAESDIKENPALLTAFDGSKEISETNPDYADVQVAFKVVEPNGSDRIIINSAQISDDTDKNGKPVEDDDSTPDEWIEGEDDQDKEYIKLTEFDLALRKWVTQAIVIENGKETITQTGHKPEDDPEDVVKVELHRKKLSSVTVKFKYSIRITNEGDIAGYAKEITDYVPEGLKFVAVDNPDWKDEGNNVISTKKLENKLLQPGQTADVEVILTWINGKDNLGLKTNIAEISEDYNDKHIPDRDSTPDNKVPGEDDIDDAPVILSITTGQARIYFTLGFAILITIASGIILIKKFVL